VFNHVKIEARSKIHMDMVNSALSQTLSGPALCQTASKYMQYLSFQCSNLTVSYESRAPMTVMTAGSDAWSMVNMHGQYDVTVIAQGKEGTSQLAAA